MPLRVTGEVPSFDQGIEDRKEGKAQARFTGVSMEEAREDREELGSLDSCKGRTPSKFFTISKNWLPQGEAVSPLPASI